MHRRLYARCDLALRLTARSPILVQGTQAPTGAATFYRARDPADNGREKYCIPATSLKGVWRSAAEGILRSFGEWLACDPFEEDRENTGKASQSCSTRLKDSSVINTPLAYAATCPACRLFGSTVHAGLLQIQDAWAADAPSPITHTGIAIDRFTGGVKQGALYSYKALPAGARFTLHLTLHNAEFWQIGLLALVSREMDDGSIRIGSGTRRGLGHVAIEWLQADWRYPKQLYEATAPGQAGSLTSAQALARNSDRVDYPAREPWLLPGLQRRPLNGWIDDGWVTFLVAGDDLACLQKACVEEALAPKLRAGAAGFAYTPPQSREVNHA